MNRRNILISLACLPFTGCFTPRKRRRRKYEEWAVGDTVRCINASEFEKSELVVGQEYKVVAIHKNYGYTNPLVNERYPVKLSVYVQHKEPTRADVLNNGWYYIAPVELFELCV